MHAVEKPWERSGSSVNAPWERSGSSVNAPWECHEKAGNRQLERCRNAMELHWNIETPRHRHLQEKSQISMRSHCALGNLRMPCSRSGNAARCDRDFSTMQMIPYQIPLGPAEMISLLSFSVEWGFLFLLNMYMSGPKEVSVPKDISLLGVWVYTILTFLARLWREKWTLIVYVCISGSSFKNAHGKKVHGKVFVSKIWMLSDRPPDHPPTRVSSKNPPLKIEHRWFW